MSNFNYPGFVRGSLLLAGILALCCGSPIAGFAQLTRLDTLFLRSLGDSILKVDHGHVRVVGDSQIASYFNTASDWPMSGRTIVALDHPSATVLLKDSSAKMHIAASAVLISPGSNIPEHRFWNVDQTVGITAQDRSDIETNRSRFVMLQHETPKSFWESTLEPAVVVLGAAVIVALFFLIRS